MVTNNSTNAILFYNSKAGSIREHSLQIIEKHFAVNNIALEVVHVPKSTQDLEALVKDAINSGIKMFIAAGGDGTISMVSSHLVNTDIPVGILPLGTGNLLAKALKIPAHLEDSLDLITTQNHTISKIDTFKLGDRYYLLNVSVGVSPEIMRSSGSSEKKRLGFIAYLFNFLQQLLGLKLYRIFIDCDYQKSSHLASEILITNDATAGIEPLSWSEDISLKDGKLDLLVFRAKSLLDVLGLLVSAFSKKGRTNPVINFLEVKEYCRIDSITKLTTQADGDVVGTTPFEIRVYPASLSVITPQDKTN